MKKIEFVIEVDTTDGSTAFKAIRSKIGDSSPKRTTPCRVGIPKTTLILKEAKNAEK